MSEQDNILWVASFDMGKKNFAFYIEEFKKNHLQTLTKIPKSQRYNDDGSPTQEFEEILDKVYTNGEKILFKVVDLTNNCKKGSYLDPETFYNMTEVLDRYSEYWEQCDVFLIERQMSQAKQFNTMALKLGQHCWSYFSFKYLRSKQIIEFPAYYKTQVLGAEKTLNLTKAGKTRYKAMDKPTRKKWSVKKALEILNKRNDGETLLELTSARKRDDLADVLCQLQAFKILSYIDKSI